MSRQREVIYGERREVLEGADLHDQIRLMIDEAVGGVRQRRDRGVPGGVGPRRAVDRAQARCTRSRCATQDLEEEAGGRDGMERDDLRRAAAWPTRRRSTTAREAEFGAEVMRELERRVLLSVLDRKWREHLYEMDYLREGIGLRAYSQRDPLVEYQREGFDMFHAMMDGIKEETVGFLFNLEVQVEEEPEEVRAHPGRRRRDRVARARWPHSLPRPRTRRTSPPRGSTRRRRRPTSPTPLRARTARPRCVGRRSTNADDPYSRRSAATRSAPAGRARSTSAATAPRAVRPARRHAPAADPLPDLSRTRGPCTSSGRRTARSGQRSRASADRGARAR